MKKTIFYSFYNKSSFLYVFEETKLNSVQICLMFYYFPYNNTNCSKRIEVYQIIL